MMMNREQRIMSGVNEHYQEALKHFKEFQIVGIFLQGSQNYGLDYEKSDIDTKLIVIPSFEDIAFNRKPVSTTHVRKNDEHIDFKDIRLYMQTFRKQNLNFLEILFTDFKIVNPEHEANWGVLVDNRERIARYNPYQAIKSMKGIAMEKYHAMEHRYPTKTHLIDTYGYDSKQLMHLLRIEQYLGRYIDGVKYADCLQASMSHYLLDVKNYHYNLEAARIVANTAINNITRVADDYCSKTKDEGNEELEDFMNKIVYLIMKKRIVKEMLNV